MAALGLLADFSLGNYRSRNGKIAIIVTCKG